MVVVVVGAEMAGSGGRAVLVPPAAGPGIIFFFSHCKNVCHDHVRRTVIF
jgi:cytochrome oxidase Cu insertion factor (SCO1/SenC/PrrC family)